MAYRTQTQGAWGTTCKGGNSACYLDANFGTCFGPNGVKIGCNTYSLTFTTSTAIHNFLPKGGSAGKLSVTATNPLAGDAGTDGVFAGQLLTAKLNAGFDACDSSFGACPGSLAALCFNIPRTDVKYGAVASACNTFTVAGLIQASDNQIGTCLLTTYPDATLNACLSALNENFDGGATNLGYLKPC
jgi:hypothetical protein